MSRYDYKPLPSGTTANMNDTINLPPELVLYIIEAHHLEASDLLNLLCASRSTHSLITSHEHSVSSSLVSHIRKPHHHTLLTCLPTQLTYIPPEKFRPRVKPLSQFIEGASFVGWSSSPIYDAKARRHLASAVHPHTFGWAYEVQFRNQLFIELPKSKLFDLQNIFVSPIFNSHSQLCHHQHATALERLKTEGLALLFYLWDARLSPINSVVGISLPLNEKSTFPSDSEARNAQESWINTRTATDLAILLTTIWIPSQTYNYGHPTTWSSTTSDPLTTHCEHGGHSPTSPSTHSLFEHPYDHAYDFVERQCIFREKVLSSGPYWFYAASQPPTPNMGRGSKFARLQGWVGENLNRGVVTLRAYEAGEEVDDPALAPPGATASQAAPSRLTLQATLLQRFCELKEVDVRHAWDEVFRVVSATAESWRKAAWLKRKAALELARRKAMEIEKRSGAEMEAAAMAEEMRRSMNVAGIGKPKPMLAGQLRAGMRSGMIGETGGMSLGGDHREEGELPLRWGGKQSSGMTTTQTAVVQSANGKAAKTSWNPDDGMTSTVFDPTELMDDDAEGCVASGMCGPPQL